MRKKGSESIERRSIHTKTVAFADTLRTNQKNETIRQSEDEKEK